MIVEIDQIKIRQVKLPFNLFNYFKGYAKQATANLNHKRDSVESSPIPKDNKLKNLTCTLYSCTFSLHYQTESLTWQKENSSCVIIFSYYSPIF